MSNETNELSDVLWLINELAVAQMVNHRDKTTESPDVLLSKLHTQLNSLNNDLLTPFILGQLEECFIQLNQLATKSSLFSSSPLLASCCLIILEKLINTEFLMQTIEHNKSKCDEYYTLAMEALNTKEILDYLQGNHQNSTLDLHELYSHSYLRMARETIRCRNRKSELLNVQEWNLRTSCFEDKYKLFLKLLLSFIDKKLNTTENLLRKIGFFVTLSDDIDLVPDLVQCELPQHLKIWLLIYIKEELEDKDLCELILLAIYNVARHEEGSNALKKLRTNDVLQDFWKQYEHKLSKHLTAMYYMAYALIVTPEQLKSAIILQDVIDYLIQNTHIASCSPDMRSDIAHISEYLVALARLLVNDNVAQYIINTWKMNETIDGLTFFNGLFQKYNDLLPNDLYLKHLSRIALFNIFCSFSFQTTAQKCLVADKKFVEIIKNASHHNNEQDVVIPPYLLQHLLSIKQAVEAILINLDLYKDDDAFRIGRSSRVTQSHVMISYSHQDRTFCRNLVRALKLNSINTWIDEDGHCRSDDCWEEIAVAIKYASYVLVIVSPYYCESVSCRKEATYADKRKKPLIAVYPNDEKYEPDEWLDIRLTGLYVRFSENGKRSFDDCITRLLEFIQPNYDKVLHTFVEKTTIPLLPIKQSDDVPVRKIQLVDIVPSTTSQLVDNRKSSIHEWTKNDVQTWFLVERQLLPQLYKLYSFADGDSLLEYAKYFIQEYEQDSKQQYEKLNKRLHNEFHIELYDNNYTDLVSSMKKLLLTYNQQSLSTTKIKRQRSSLCLLL